MDNLNDKLSNEAERQPSCLGAVSGSFMCAHGSENRCKEQCYTCSEDEKCDNEWANACPLCKSKDFFDVNDHYTLCNKCGFSFVG